MKWYEYDLKTLGEDTCREKKRICQHEAGHGIVCSAFGRRWGCRVWESRLGVWHGRTMHLHTNYSAFEAAAIGWGGAIANAVTNYRIPASHMFDDRKSLAQFCGVRYLSTTDMEPIMGCPSAEFNGKTLWGDYAYETFAEAWEAFFKYRRQWRGFVRELMEKHYVSPGMDGSKIVAPTPEIPRASL
jgi:hypothetical protein